MMLLDRNVRTSRRGNVEYLRVGLKGMHPSKARWMEIGKVREGAAPSLTCRVIQAFGGPKVLQWGGMIRRIIHLQVTLIQYGTIVVNIWF